MNSSSYSDWMGNLGTELLNAPINSLAIPGSHDTFSYTVKESNDISPDADAIVKDLVKVFGDSAKKIIHKWSVTQSFNVYDQLKLGIRYLDIRIAYLPKMDDLCFVHGLYGDCITEGLQQIDTFLNEHPKEVVLLDFNHFYLMDGNQHEILLATLESLFANKLCPVMNCHEVTLEMLWSKGFQVLLFYNDDIARFQENVWPDRLILSPWANTCNPKDLIDFLEINYEKGRANDKFYVTQGILTPNVSYILKHLTGSLKGLSDEAYQAFIPWIMSKSKGCDKINTVISDFINESYVTEILSLNK